MGPGRGRWELGARAAGPAAGIELSDEALAARRARNRVYWARWDLDRRVCLRASHAFRADPRKLRLFAMFTQKSGRAARTSKGGDAPA